jgi:hypothetical protein
MRAVQFVIALSVLVGSGHLFSQGAPYVATVEISHARDITYNGIASTDVTGRDVSTGDINNDGFPDLIIGARQSDPGGKADAGNVYIYFGPIQGSGTVEISTAGAAGPDITIHGAEAGDQAGIGVASGDINNDGVPDLLIGARYASPGGRVHAGQGYVVFGPLYEGVYDVSAIAGITLNGKAAGDECGVGVAAGDLNADGIADLVIGARHADPNGLLDAGEAYVMYGPISLGTYELTNAADLTIEGVEFDEKSGYGLGTGDVNGDGVADLIDGAWANDANGLLDAGRVYVFFGPLGLGTMTVSAASITVSGEAAEDHLGVDADLGDVNGDGIADLLLGASEADPGGRDKAGKAYVVYGPLNAGAYNLPNLPRTVYNGIAATDYFGIGLSAGDLNGDRLPDTVFGAFRADPSSSRANAGQVYLVFGRCGGRLPTISGTPGDDAIEGTPGDDVIVGLSGNDSIFALAGNDVVCGGPGNDVLFGNQGDDVLIGAQGNDMFMCGPGSDTANGGAGSDSAAIDCEVKQSVP